MLGSGAQRCIDFHCATSACLPVEDGPFWDALVQHFLQGHRLSRELEIVMEPALARSLFVLDGVGDFSSAASMELDNICEPPEPQPIRTQRQASYHPDTRTDLDLLLVDALVGVGSQDRVLVLDPHAVDMDQRALTLAVGQVFERRDGEKIVDLHGTFNSAACGVGPVKTRSLFLRSTLRCVRIALIASPFTLMT